MTLKSTYKYKRILEINDLIDQYDAFIFDIWGVFHDGGDLFKGVATLINELQKIKIVRIISNAPRLRTTTAEMLIKSGMNIDPNSLWTSGEIARIMMRDAKKYLGLNSLTIYQPRRESNLEILNDLNVKITDRPEDANLILLTVFQDMHEDASKTIESLKKAASLKIPALCANPDVEVMHMGSIRRCAGYFAKIYNELGGKIIYSGKPEKLIFEHCFETFDKSKKALMVGDTFSTDIEGAALFGIDSALVTSGNVARAIATLEIKDELEAINKICSKEKYQPTHIVRTKKL